MSRIPENNIDKLFQQGTEHQEFQYREDAWSAMDAMLDQRDRKKALIWWISGALLVLSLIATLCIINRQNNTVLVSQNMEDAETIEQIAEVITQDDLATPFASEEAKIQTLEEASIKSASQNVLVQQVNTIANTTQKLLPIAEIKEQSIFSEVNKSKAVSNPVYLKESNESLGLSTANMSSLSENTRNLIYITSLSSLDKSLLISDDKAQDLPLELVPVNIIEENNNTLWNRTHFTLYGGPEWSVLRRNSSPMLGQRVGLAVTFDISDRWYASLGAAYSRKIFNGAGADFADQALFGDTVPEKMKGKSRFIEFPVSLGYKFSKSEKQSWAVELGMTNFNHRSEWYGFEYSDDQMKPGLLMEVPDQEVNKLILGSARVALRYQRNTYGQKAFEISPYVQVPMKGIGMGELSIFNSGIEIAYRFK